MFLGCADQTLKHWRDDALRRTIVQLDAMDPHIQNDALRVFVTSVKTLLQQVMNASFDGSSMSYLIVKYNDLKIAVNKLTKGISDAQFTEKMKQVEENIDNATRCHKNDLDLYLQAILHMIGAHMMLIYYEFMNETWLKSVAMGIPGISHILQDA
jgi:hypothetical protein